MQSYRELTKLKMTNSSPSPSQTRAEAPNRRVYVVLTIATLFLFLWIGLSVFLPRAVPLQTEPGDFSNRAGTCSPQGDCSSSSSCRNDRKSGSGRLPDGATARDRPGASGTVIDAGRPPGTVGLASDFCPKHHGAYPESTANTMALLLSAHYDSVVTSPGAGDDGAGRSAHCWKSREL